MSCTAEQIAEKRRQAMERLKQTKNAGQTHANVQTKSHTSPSTAAKFYGNEKNHKVNTLNQYETKMKQQATHSANNRIMSQPYPKRDGSNRNTPPKSTPGKNTNQKLASVFTKVVTCTCAMISPKRFHVIQSGFHAQLIDVFKSIPMRSFDQDTKIWSFDLSTYKEVQDKINALNPDVVIGPMPKFVLNLLNQEEKESDLMCIEATEKKISTQLLNFQKYGVAFAIKNSGRCMIADDMGLGKTFQAIAVADFYKDDWPLLVITTATARESWVIHIKELLPWVSGDSVKCLTSTQDYVGNCKVLITSYSLMDKNVQRLYEKKFGFVILDESHTIKNFKTKSAQSATRLCEKAKRIILLSGTPALSRPAELFCQLNLIDPKFFGGFKAYSTRYCDR